jgi:aquaporin Z
MRRPGTNWLEYGLEAWALGLFMLVACGAGVVLFHPGSPVVSALPDPLLRRVLMGITMGLTAILNIYSPWGRQSGAHMNPAVTLTYYRLGRIAGPDALGYVAGQFLGGVSGTLVAAVLLSRWIADQSVNYVVTAPGPAGAEWAFVAELAISFGLMLTVLTLSGLSRWTRWTGVAAGCLVAAYITLESPISGMSMNPARTLGSALPAMQWDALWIYFTAPPLGMLLAAEARHWLGLRHDRHCAKLHHDPRFRCLFCEYRRLHY